MENRLRRIDATHQPTCKKESAVQRSFPRHAGEGRDGGVFLRKTSATKAVY